jgi:hypothetical protein
LYIPEKRFERIARYALEEVGLLPDSPQPIRIDRYAEKKWGITEDYIALPDDTLGRAGFDINGIRSIDINRSLAEDTSFSAQRRLRSTMAHEIGHGLVHTDLWIEVLVRRTQGELIPNGNAPSITNQGFSCRSATIVDQRCESSTFEWWEYQANKLMSALLLPWHLVMPVAASRKGQLTDPDVYERSCAFELLKLDVADIFNVNPVMVKIRLQGWVEELVKAPELPF